MNLRNLLRYNTTVEMSRTEMEFLKRFKMEKPGFLFLAIHSSIQLVHLSYTLEFLPSGPSLPAEKRLGDLLNNFNRTCSVFHPYIAEGKNVMLIFKHGLIIWSIINVLPMVFQVCGTNAVYVIYHVGTGAACQVGAFCNKQFSFSKEK